MLNDTILIVIIIIVVIAIIGYAYYACCMKKPRTSGGDPLMANDLTIDMYTDMFTFSDCLKALKLETRNPQSPILDAPQWKTADEILQRYSYFGEDATSKYHYSLMDLYEKERDICNSYAKSSFAASCATQVEDSLRAMVLDMANKIFGSLWDSDKAEHRLFSKYLDNNENEELWNDFKKCASKMYSLDDLLFEDYNLSKSERINVIITWRLYFELLSFFNQRSHLHM
jgi:hypothetical protein